VILYQLLKLLSPEETSPQTKTPPLREKKLQMTLRFYFSLFSLLINMINRVVVESKTRKTKTAGGREKELIDRNTLSLPTLHFFI